MKDVKKLASLGKQPVKEQAAPKSRSTVKTSPKSQKKGKEEESGDLKAPTFRE